MQYSSLFGLHQPESDGVRIVRHSRRFLGRHLNVAADIQKNPAAPEKSRSIPSPTSSGNAILVHIIPSGRTGEIATEHVTHANSQIGGPPADLLINQGVRDNVSGHTTRAPPALTLFLS